MKADAFALVVGAGVVGLAVAARLASPRRLVWVVERHGAPATEGTSRNSGVVHAGIYYPPESRKARSCVRGNALLWERCERLRIPHRRCGKVVVACAGDEIAELERLHAQGGAAGAPGLRLIDASDLRRREPCVRGAAALLSASSGIVDPMALALSFAAEAEAAGAQLVLRSELVALEPHGAGGLRAAVKGADGELATIRAQWVVNAAGLAADRVAALAGIDAEATGIRIHPCKGDWFALAPGAPLRFSGLVYPVHRGPGLGVHVTPDLAGRLRLGPDAEFVEAPRYTVDPAKADTFAESARRYLPALRADWLQPDQAGVRARLAGPGEGFRDFVVREESALGAPGLIDLAGIESPGLTAAPALAEEVAALVA